MKIPIKVLLMAYFGRSKPNEFVLDFSFDDNNNRFTNKNTHSTKDYTHRLQGIKNDHFWIIFA